ncbi:hypothetical protein Scep_019254 [Stephania cephalantha]|uniref:Uncharacterized protein n=1 Tax=Stephania cephalantha TaxID=152367 RepID=A0AAP0IAT7_9MAGN
MTVHQISRCVHQISRFDEYPPRTKIPKSHKFVVASRLALSALRLETAESARVARRLRLRAPSRPSWPHNRLGMRSRGPTTPNLGLDSAQLRVRALLFDKAGVSLFLDLLRLYLRLHGDDVYFSLEDFGFGLVMGLKLKLGAKIRIQCEIGCLMCRGAGIDLLSLNVMEGKICWDLYIEGLVINLDGNLLDALGTAIKVAIVPFFS